MDTCRVPYKKKRENGIRALYDPLERCSLLFLSQYLCLSFPIDENRVQWPVTTEVKVGATFHQVSMEWFI